MRRTYVLSIFCTFLLLFMTGSALAQITPGCDRAADEATRAATARALVDVEADNYESVINYWAEDIIYKEPVLTNSGRQEMLDYLAAVFGGSYYGFPSDKAVTVKDELIKTHPDDSATYIATMEWSATLGTAFYIQTGMSIIKFRPGEGCPYYQRDYFTEGDTWWNLPPWQPDVMVSRTAYILLFGLSGRCFDGDGDGYTKYEAATGCPYSGLDCNDFVAEINPGATEILENGIDDDCSFLTPDAPPWGTPASVINAEYKESSDVVNGLLVLCLPLGAVLLLRGLRRGK